MIHPPAPECDLEHFVELTRDLAPLLRKRRIFVTGGTGFFGNWIVQCFLHMNRRLALGSSLVVLTRDSERFLARSPQLRRDDALETVEGDIRDFPFPLGRHDYLIHAATESVVPSSTSAGEQYGAIVDGTRRVLAFAEARGLERLLYVSSGAVYGPQPRDVLRVGEDDPFQPDESAYAAGKRAAERLCLEQSGSRMATVIARGFAFCGPYLPLEAHFAAGNFMADALEGRDIEIKGDGRPLRSYLYAADLAVWLWTMLVSGGASEAYNVGAERPVSIRELAERTVALVRPGLRVRIHQSEGGGNEPAPRYVPSTRKAEEGLGLRAVIDLDEAIRRTAEWHRGQRAAAKGGTD